jgi:hypothetical protein
MCFEWKVNVAILASKLPNIIWICGRVEWKHIMGEPLLFKKVTYNKYDSTQ